MARVLIDTNLLLRIADPGASQRVAATDSISRLIDAGHEVCLCPQNMIEFWAVATRPISANGLGWCVLAAVARTHHCDAILTFNTSDFAAIPGLTFIHPDSPEAWPFVTPV